MTMISLNGDSNSYDDGKDGVVIVDNFESIRGGRSLDVTGFVQPYIRAGHVIIRDTATKKIFKPMPVNDIQSIATTGALVAGSGYTNGTYTDVPLSGGSGTGARGTVTVAGTVVTAITITSRGKGYAALDVLTPQQYVGGGTGASIAVATVNSDYAYQSLPAGYEYCGLLISTIKTTLAFAGIMVRGSVNTVAAPGGFSTIAAAFKTAMPLINQIED